MLKSLFSSKDDREQGRGCKLGGASQTYLHLTELTQAWRSSWRQERFIVLPGAGSAASTRDPGGVLSTLLTLAVCVGGFFLFSDKEGRLGQVRHIAPALISGKQPEF